MIISLQRKIFSALTIVLLISLSFSCNVTKTAKGPVNKTNQEIVEYHLPSVSLLYKMYFIIYESKELTKSWAYVYRSDDAIDKVRLRNIHSKVYPEIKGKIDKLKRKWTIKEQLLFREICKDVENLFDNEKQIMDQLNSYEAYEDVMIVFQVDSKFERGADSITTFTETILKKLNELIAMREEKLKGIVQEAK